MPRLSKIAAVLLMVLLATPLTASLGRGDIVDFLPRAGHTPATGTRGDAAGWFRGAMRQALPGAQPTQRLRRTLGSQARIRTFLAPGASGTATPGRDDTRRTAGAEIFSLVLRI